jgi:hypothetical protein
MMILLYIARTQQRFPLLLLFRLLFIPLFSQVLELKVMNGFALCLKEMRMNGLGGI